MLVFQRYCLAGNVFCEQLSCFSVFGDIRLHFLLGVSKSETANGKHFVIMHCITEYLLQNNEKNIYV